MLLLIQQFYRTVFKAKDDRWIIDAYKELSDYGISLTEENTAFNTKLNQIIKKHPFSRSLTIPVNGVVASYFEFLKSIDDETDIQKNIEMLNALSSALSYRLRTKNTSAIDFRSDVNDLNPILYKVKREKERELNLLPDNATASVLSLDEH